MSRRVLLRDIAHARAGDKGDTSSVAVFVFDPRHYAAVADQLTPGRLKARLGGVLRGEVARYDLPGLHGFNFVMTRALEGGVNASLNLDTHGKSWSYLLLGEEIDLEE